MSNPNKLDIVNDTKALISIPNDKLIRRFQTKNKGKIRSVNDPVPELKTILKTWNPVITDYYVSLLKEYDLTDIAHAYLPNKSIQTNANRHKRSRIIQFDFKGFYDCCQFDYFKQVFYDVDPNLQSRNEYLVKRLVIDPNTKGVTQGLPVSGALAGITLIPFWRELKNLLPKSIRFTQYSDDLTFSYTGKELDCFNIPDLTAIIYQALENTGLEFQLNTDKTRSQKSQYRKITGIRINHRNQTTASRKDYRFLRHALYILSHSDDLNKELITWGFQSKEAFIGKVSYMRSIDETGKIDKLIMDYASTCRKHNLFTTWINKNRSTQSAFM